MNKDKEYERIVDRKVRQEREQDRKELNRNFVKRVTEKDRKSKTEREQARLDHEFEVRRFARREFERDPIAEVPDEVKLPMDYFDEVAHKVSYNEVYAEHYGRRYEDTNLDKYRSMSERMSGCHKSWFGDRYKAAGVFHAKRVFHCHNRWCWLCTHIKQAKRLYKYHIKFEKLLQEYDLYHLVFTVRNVGGDVLKETIVKMQNALKKIIRYFQGDGKIRGMDFSQYGWAGAIRSFEIVINPTDYHPHLHVLFMLDKGLEFPKTKINKFSFNKGSSIPVRKFSELEIILQKMFYLAVNGIKINMENIGKLKLGYSCTMDFVEGEAWHEVFKYATKMSKDGASTCTYEQFCLLDDILCHMRMIQGYGIFYDEDDTDDEKDPTAEILFEKVLVLLSQREAPERDVSVQLDKLVEQMHRDGLTVISKNMSYKYLKAVVDDLRRELEVDGYSDPF